MSNAALVIITKLRCCAGWPAVLLTWAWALVIWQIADFVKFLASWNMQAAEDVSAQCKESGEAKPTWVKVLDMPGIVGDRISNTVDHTFQVSEQECLRE